MSRRKPDADTTSSSTTSRDTRSAITSPPTEMTPKQARRVLAEAAERAGRKIRLRAEDALFATQLAFVQDPAQLTAACCSRRAGKSTGSAFKLLKTGSKHPNTTPLFVVMSRADAKNIIWPAFQMFDRRYGLGLEYKENTGDVVLPNGSRVLLRGAGSRREIDKLRGPAYPGAVIDEGQGFGADLNYMIDDVLGPAVAQYADGWIAVTGTPNAACAGAFHDICTKPDSGFSVHAWTWRDNEAVANLAEWAANLMRRRGWTDQHPTYLREYEGVWTRDAEGLVFEFNPGLNLQPRFDAKSQHDWRYVLGIDLGFNDPTAFVVMAYSRASGQAVVVESFKKAGLYPSTAAVHVERFMQAYRLDRIVADTGGLGKGYEQEWVQRFGIPVTAAQKHGKMGYIQILNGDFTAGRLRIAADRNRPLIEEISLLQWDSDKMLENRWEADRRFDDHLADAMLYAWRECKHHNLETQHNPPRFGTEEYWGAEEEAMWAEARRELEDAERPWWETLSPPLWD